MINGNLEGIKDSYILELEELFNFKTTLGDFINVSLLNSVCDLSRKINREIAIFIDKPGRVLGLNVGERFKVSIIGFSVREFATISAFKRA